VQPQLSDPEAQMILQFLELLESLALHHPQKLLAAIPALLTQLPTLTELHAVSSNSHKQKPSRGRSPSKKPRPALRLIPSTPET